VAGRVARRGGWAVDLARDRVQLSDEVCGIYDIPAGTVMSINQARDLYTTSSKQRIDALVADCLRYGTAIDEELKLITPRGRLRWVRNMGYAISNSQGRRTLIRGGLQDITQQ